MWVNLMNSLLSCWPCILFLLHTDDSLENATSTISYEGRDSKFLRNVGMQPKDHTTQTTLNTADYMLPPSSVLMVKAPCSSETQAYNRNATRRKKFKTETTIFVKYIA